MNVNRFQKTLFEMSFFLTSILVSCYYITHNGRRKDDRQDSDNKIMIFSIASASASVSVCASIIHVSMSYFYVSIAVVKFSVTCRWLVRMMFYSAAAQHRSALLVLRLLYLFMIMHLNSSRSKECIG